MQVCSVLTLTSASISALCKGTMWHLLSKSTLVASHLHNLQTFSSGRVDSIQTYLARVPLVQHKESSVIQKHVDGTTTSWLLAESGKTAEVFRFCTPWNSSGLHSAVETGKLPGSVQISRSLLAPPTAPLSGAREPRAVALGWCSVSDFRTIGEMWP